jgi:carbonic anhydrase
MKTLDELFKNNREWSERIRSQDPEFFSKLSRQQTPNYLWIGCADSRVPANEIVGLLPGELFVHRNVANVVVHTDLNCLSVLQFAVDVLRVEHVIVCGHYGCGGIEAAWKKTPLGLADNWLRHVQDVAEQHADQFARGVSDSHAMERLAELNVLSQVANVCRTTIAIDAWRRAQPLSVHGVIYGLQDGRLRDLGLTVSRDGTLADEYARAIAGLGRPEESKHAGRTER